MYQVIQKIDKDNYVNLKTGEIQEFKHGVTRADNIRSVQKTMKLGRDLINTNITNPKNAKFITGTYVENMTDTKKLYNDFNYFIKKLKKRYGSFEHIVAIEPQERGAWHFHLLPIFNKIAPFMDNKEVQKIWGNGITYVTKIDEVDNVGAYLTSYLTDIQLTEQNANIIANEPGLQITEKNEKYYVKGARLKYYPKGMRIFRYSRGIKKPIVEQMKYKQIKKEIGSAKPTYTSTVQLESDTFNSLVHKEYYNSLHSGYHNHNKK